MSQPLYLNFSTPTSSIGAGEVIFKVSATSRQPVRAAWTMDRLINDRSISLGYSLDSSSFGAYTSALNSYLTFALSITYPSTPLLTRYLSILFFSPAISILNQSTHTCRAFAGSSSLFPRNSSASQVSPRFSHHGWLSATVWNAHQAQVPLFTCRLSACPRQSSTYTFS